VLRSYNNHACRCDAVLSTCGLGDDHYGKMGKRDDASFGVCLALDLLSARARRSVVFPSKPPSEGLTPLPSHL
jgi:hypothetical protein